MSGFMYRLRIKRWVIFRSDNYSTSLISLKNSLGLKRFDARTEAHRNQLNWNFLT